MKKADKAFVLFACGCVFLGVVGIATTLMRGKQV